jgi:hypothetical protein
MSSFTHRIRGWRHSWLHSDLVAWPVTLAMLVIVLVCIGIFLLLGDFIGLFVAKLAFVLLIGGLLALLLRLGGKRRETMAGVTVAPQDGWHRVLVIANRGLEEPALCAEVCSRGTRPRTEAMIIAPVVASSWMHTVTDDVGPELGLAQGRVDVALKTLVSKGIKANGHAAFGQPMTSLLDGLREFPASEVVMLNGGENDWEDASVFAERVRAELGLRVTEVNPSNASPHHTLPPTGRNAPGAGPLARKSARRPPPVSKLSAGP